MAAGGTATGARRLQASLFLICCCAAAAVPHGLPAAQALWPATALTLLLGFYPALVLDIIGPSVSALVGNYETALATFEAASQFASN